MVIYGFSFSAVTCPAQEPLQIEDTNILFYGKVINQYYKPVAGANVQVDIFRSGTNKIEAVQKITIKTNKKGLFTVRDKGCSIYIKSIEKNGYEFLHRKNLDQNFEYSSKYSKAVFVPDRNAPLIFHLQKMEGEPAYLINQSSLERNFPPTQSPEYGLNLGGSWIDDNGRFQKDSGHIDLKIKCNLSMNQKQFELFILSLDSNSGILQSDKLLDQAPADGYKPEIVIKVDIPERYEEKKIYVYAKSRGGLMYSRLELGLTVRPSNLLVSMDIWTNPESSRNLKYNKSFQEYAKKERYNTREHYYQVSLRTKSRQDHFKYEPRRKLIAKSKSQTKTPRLTPVRYSGVYGY